MTPPPSENASLQSPGTPGGRDCLAALSETARTRAWERFQIIRPFLHDGVPLPAVAQQAAISLRTVRRWVAAYRQGGLTALGRQQRSDHGTRRARATPLVELVEALTLQTPPRSVAAIYRQVAATERASRTRPQLRSRP